MVLWCSRRYRQRLLLRRRYAPTPPQVPLKTTSYSRKISLDSRIKTHHSQHRRRRGDRQISNAKGSLANRRLLQSKWTLTELETEQLKRNEHFSGAVLFCQPHQQLFTHSFELEIDKPVVMRYSTSFDFSTSRALYCWQNKGFSWSKNNNNNTNKQVSRSFLTSRAYGRRSRLMDSSRQIGNLGTLLIRVWTDVA